MDETKTPKTRLPLPNDVAALSDAELMTIIESWAWAGERVEWDAVIGHSSQVAALKRTGELLRLSLSAPERLAALGIRSSGTGNAILCGPSGTGKTMMARALATSAGDGRSILALPTADLTASNVARIYQVLAASGRPWLCLIDECERLVGPDYMADVEVRVAFLAALDGLHTGSVQTVGTTTLDADRIHPPVKRPGRMAPVLTLGLPSPTDRRRMLEIELARRPAFDIDVARLTDRTHGWSGAELAGMIEEGAIRALVSGHTDPTTGLPALSMGDLESCAAERWELADLSAFQPASLTSSRHESGHSVFAAITNGIETVTEVRLTGEGGHTTMVRGSGAETHQDLSPSAPTCLTRTEIRSGIVGLLCGAMAEQVLEGEVTTGSGHDRAQATEQAGQLIGLDAPAHFQQIEASAGERPVGPDAYREARWRAIEVVMTECKADAERFVTAHAASILHFADTLFAAPDTRLTGPELAAALRDALAIE